MREKREGNGGKRINERSKGRGGKVGGGTGREKLEENRGKKIGAEGSKEGGRKQEQERWERIE